MPVVVPGNIIAPATGTPQVVPVNLPVPSFVNDTDGLNVQSILNDMITSFEATTGRTLYPAQVEQLLINLYAYRESLVRNAIQYCGLQCLLAFASYPALDYLGQLLNVERLPPQPSAAPLLFTLTAVQTTATDIPAGTQVGTKDGAFIFATSTDLSIPAGELTGTVTGICTTAGSGANGYLAGQISVLLATLPLVSTVANTAASANGDEQELDDHFRTRIQAAPNLLTTAGPTGSYRALALEVSSSIVDVFIPSVPAIPGQVQVYILTGPVSQPSASPNNAGIASGALITAVYNALSAATVRPMNDSVVVNPVTEVDYTVTGVITLYGNVNYAAVAAGITAAAQQLALSLAASIAQDIVLSQWVAALSVAGVYDVDITLAANIAGVPLVPTADGGFVLSGSQWANCTALNLTIVLGTKNQPTS